MTNEEPSHFLEKRRAVRTSVPAKTTSFLINSASSLDEVHVEDMSEVGMLISFKQNQYGYPVDFVINDILVHISPGQLNAGHRSILLSYDGRVVRSFFDQASQSTCYGIEFTHKILSLNDKIKKLVKNDAICKRLKQLVGPE